MSNPNGTREYVFSVRRGEDGGLQEFRIVGALGITVLEALLLVYRNEDSCLGFRYSCTVGRCYSCLVQMNGRTIVSCRELLADGAILEPMLNRIAIRDLATADSFARPSLGRTDNVEDSRTNQSPSNGVASPSTHSPS